MNKTVIWMCLSLLSVLAIYFKYSSNYDIKENFWTNGPQLTTQASCCNRNGHPGNPLGNGLSVDGTVISSNPNLARSGMSNAGHVYGREPHPLGSLSYNAAANAPVSALGAGPSVAASSNMGRTALTFEGYSDNKTPAFHALQPNAASQNHVNPPTINCDRLVSVTTRRRNLRAQNDFIRGDLAIANSNPSNSSSLFGYPGSAVTDLRVGATSVLTGMDNSSVTDTASLMLGHTMDSAFGGGSYGGLSNTPMAVLNQTALNMAAQDQNKNVGTNLGQGYSGVEVSMF
jgi:hypothetical protein